VEGGRTPADRKQAFEAIEKLVKDKEDVGAIFHNVTLAEPK